MNFTRWVKALKVAATYIGTVVGAGFASGQEIMKFFTLFGSFGLVGAFLAAALFIWWGTLILQLGYQLQARSHQEIFRYLWGNRLGNFVDSLVTFFLFASLCVMLAGTGALTKEYLNLPWQLGIFFTSILVLVTLFYGLKGIIAVNSIIVPSMTIMVLGIGGYTLVGKDLSNIFAPIVTSLPAAAPHWLLSTFSYVAFNLILSTAVLAPLGREIGCAKILRTGGILGGLGLGVMAVIIVSCQLLHFPALSGYEVPMLYLVKYAFPLVQGVFALVLWAEIFSTLIADLYGFATRFASWLGWSFEVVAVISLMAAAFFSRIGFAKLVGTVYPLLGYVGLAYVASLSLASIQRASR